MFNKTEIEQQVAEFLLQIKAIKLQPDNPFTWASGWKSPIYCDNRVTLSHPTIRTYIRQKLSQIIQEEFGAVGCIAGVATAGIPQGVLVAQELGLPFIYVRSKPKDHGTGSMIEGEVIPGQRVVVIEDLISTGKSSLHCPWIRKRRRRITTKPFQKKGLKMRPSAPCAVRNSVP